MTSRQTTGTGAGFNKLGRPANAHAVRQLRRCALCRKVGFLPHMVTSPTGPVHGACLVATMSEEEVLALPPEQAQKLCLHEIGPTLMRQLIAQDDARKDSVDG